MSDVVRLIPPTRAQPAAGLSRWPAAFAPRFFLGLVVGLVWLGPAWLDSRFGYMVLAWDVVLAVIWWRDWSRLPGPEKLKVTREWSDPLSLGSSCRVKLEVRAESDVAIVATLEDEVAASLRSEPSRLTLLIPARRPASGTYEIRPRERGVVAMGRAFIRYSTQLKLAERRAVANLEQNVRVYPNLEEAKKLKLYLMRSRQIELEKRTQHRPERGREFESLREYRDGDEPRDICWTATARKARLVTKVYRPERSQTVVLAVDAGRLMLARSGPFSKLDYAVTAALSLAQVAMSGGDAVGVIAYGQRVQAEISPSRGPAHLRLILDQLALVRGEISEADHARASETLLKTQRRRSLVVWITDLAETAATPEVIESAMRLAHHHLVLFAVVGQPDLKSLLARRPASSADMYRYVAGLELIQRREMLIRRMHEQGVLALELMPSGLALGLVNQYLRIKEESLL